MKSTTVEQEVADLVAKACEVLPAPYSSLCSSIVQTYVPQIMKWVEQGMEKVDICTKIGLCQAASANKARVTKDVEEKWTCSMCEVVVKAAAELLNETSVAEEIILAIDKLCNLMPEPAGSQCHMIVGVSGALIISLLRQGVDPQEICAFIGMCDPVQGVKRARAPKDVGEKWTCSMCEFVVKGVEQFVNETSVAEEIMVALGKLCKLMPEPYGSQCELIVAVSGALIISQLKQGVDPQEVCEFIGMCDPVQGVKRGRVPRLAGGDWSCKMCETVVDTISKSMESTTVIEEVTVIVEQVCDLIEAPYSTLCHTLVKTYTALIMELLDQGLAALDICVRIGLCPGTRRPFPHARSQVVAQSEKKTIQCDACKYFFYWAGSELATVTKQELWRLVSVECPKVEYIKHVCSFTTEDNINTFVDLIAAQVEPQEACQWVGLC